MKHTILVLLLMVRVFITPLYSQNIIVNGPPALKLYSGSNNPNGRILSAQAGELYLESAPGQVGTLWVNQTGGKYGWVKVSTSSTPLPAWLLTGNAGTDGTFNFCGTSDLQPFSIIAGGDMAGNSNDFPIITLSKRGTGTNRTTISLTAQDSVYDYANNILMDSAIRHGFANYDGTFYSKLIFNPTYIYYLFPTNDDTAFVVNQTLFHINEQVQITDGTQGINKVLSSDAVGRASWQSTSSLVGPTGAMGTPGSNGATGATGAVGPTGIQGATGTIGITGTTGVTGPTGAGLSPTGIVGTSSTPGISAGSGAGTSPTISIQGTNIGGVINVTPGITAAASATLVTITYSGLTYGNDSYVVLYPNNAATALLSGVTMVSATGNTTTFVVTTGTTALTPATAYSWNYIVVGN